MDLWLVDFNHLTNICLNFFVINDTKICNIVFTSFYNFWYFDNEMSHFLEGWNLLKIEALSLSLNYPCVWNLESLNYNTIVTKNIFEFFTTLFLNYLLKKNMYGPVISGVLLWNRLMAQWPNPRRLTGPRTVNWGGNGNSVEGRTENHLW